MIDSVTGAYIFGIHLSRISMIQLPAVEHVGMKVIPCHPYQELSTETEARVFSKSGAWGLGFFNLDTLPSFEIHPDDLRWQLNVETLNLRL